MQTVKDNVNPNDHWQFDSEVTDAFEDMLARSIPQYDVMRQAVFDIGQRYVAQYTHIVDLGCSRGDALASFVDQFGAHNRYLGIDVSQPMLEAARQQFGGMIQAEIVSIQRLDLRQDFPPVQASLMLSVLTLQFTPIEYRQQIVQQVYDHLLPGGAFILVEKVLGANADIDRLMVDVYYQLKAENGYSQEQIERKRLSLEGVLVPVTARWNEELLQAAGFRKVDCFWRWMNFAGWIAVK